MRWDFAHLTVELGAWEFMRDSRRGGQEKDTLTHINIGGGGGEGGPLGGTGKERGIKGRTRGGGGY